MGAPQAEHSSPHSNRVATNIKRVFTDARTRRILIVAGEPGMRTLLRSWLEQEGFAVDDVPDLEGAVRAISGRNIFSGVICDQRLPDGEGVQLMHWLRREVFTMPFLLITSWRIPGLLPRWGFDYLLTPFDSRTLCAALRQFMESESDNQGIRKRSAVSAKAF
jgi:DNA-binding NtrC family response regulator